MKIAKFSYHLFKDKKKKRLEAKSGVKKFEEYGLRLYTGCQGSGKTISLVEQLERYRTIYPDAYIATNFGYIHENCSLKSIYDLVQLPRLVREKNFNGLIIGFDEIQNDFDNSMRSFPVTVLRTITQQRKQAIKILATSQVFTRVAKAIREQTFEVVQCRTIAGRWTFQKWYDPVELEYYIQNPNRDKKISTKYKYNFVQSDEIRDLFDSYAVIDNLNDLDTDDLSVRFNASISQLQTNNHKTRRKKKKVTTKL